MTTNWYGFYANPSDRQWVLDQLGKHGQLNDYEVQLRQRDGTTLWVLLSARLNPEENCVDGVFVDFTDRKRTEEALRESE